MKASQHSGFLSFILSAASPDGSELTYRMAGEFNCSLVHNCSSFVDTDQNRN